jgi:uncharacterized membrane protein YhaH (DUF805 family)
MLAGLLGVWLGGAAGLMAGVATGILVGALLQAIPINALQIQRLHDFGWSARVLLGSVFFVVVPLLLFVAAIATRFAHLETVGPWLLGAAFIGIAAYIGLGWFLLCVEAPKKENQFGPSPTD